jgi:hypothetical protein
MMHAWKLATLALGIGILIAGAAIEQLPDWDVGVSVLMAVLTYLTAPFFIRTIYRQQWRMLPLAVFLAWLSIDGSYCLYSEAMGHIYVREANAIASTPLYLIMGFVWLWDGTLTELFHSICALRHQQPPP